MLTSPTRRLGPSWRQVTAALLTVLPAAVFLQFVLLHSRHGITADGGTGSSPGRETAGSGSGGNDVAGDASTVCRPLSEIGAVAAGVAVNNTVLMTVKICISWA